MKRFSAVALLLVIALFANIHTMHAQDYQSLWKEVKKHEDDNLPKSAYKTADKIYQKAAAEKNSPQLLKAFIYRMKFQNEYKENAFESLIAELDSTVQTARFPESAVMHSMLADMYLMYYRANRYQFINRSNTVNFDNADIQTWTLDYLAYKVIEQYRLSLKEKEKLQKIPVSNFDLLIDKGEKRNLRPTLYDFLAHKALDIFQQSELSLTKPINYFEIDEDFYFQSAKRFVLNKIESQDSLSLQYQSVVLFQELLSFRLSQAENKAALTDADLRRLQYMYAHSVNPDKDKLYFDALNRMEQQIGETEAVAPVKYAIAAYYYQNAFKYKAGEASTEQFKDFNKKALTICEEITEKYPDSESAEQAKALISLIKTHYLSAETEDVMMPNKAFPFKVNFQNTPKVFIRIAAIDRSKYDKISDKYYGYEQYDALLKEAETVKSFIKELPEDGDYNLHSVQLIADALPIGYYIIFLSDNEKFTYKEAQTAYTAFTVSDIAYAKQRLADNSYRFIVQSRTDGKPLQGVTCNVFISKYSGVLSRYVKEKVATLTTDENGMIHLTKKISGSESAYIEFSYNDDFLSSENSYYIYNHGSNYAASTDIKFFTDRAIYRPGQTIHFKGLVLSSHKDETRILSKHNTTVELIDPNYQKVAELKLSSNEFGTFSGSFDIPKNLLNGQFTIRTPHGSKSVSVEEYKRPKFETELLPFDGRYRLNDKVQVKGKALSYAGTPITEAKVSYRITRSPYWWGWWSYYYNSQEVEIAHGNALTDDKGHYEFDFQAVPDRSLKESPYLAFNYTVHVDVTDINGETQSTSGYLQVGYRDLRLSMNVPASLNKQNVKTRKMKTKVVLSTLNLNGQFVPAQGEIKVYRLKTPEIIYKPSYWTTADKQVYQAEEWNKKVEGHLLAEENKPENFDKEKLVFETDFNTKESGEIDFKFLNDAAQGKYLIEIDSKDYFGNPVSHKQFFSYTDNTADAMPENTPLYMEALSPRCEPGDTAKFLVGSSYNDAYILYQIEHKRAIVKQEYIKLSDKKQLIEIPVEEKHRGNFSVHFMLMRENRFYTKNSVVTVPFSNKELDVEFKTFRDKLQPGQKEEWQIIIKDADGQAAVAEMLAGMYDASLDQFAANYWSLNIYPYFYTQMNWSGERFKMQNLQILKKDMDQTYYAKTGSYDQFDWFGFSYYSYRGYNQRYYARSSGVLKQKSMSDSVDETVVTDPETGQDVYMEEAEEMDMDNGIADKDAEKKEAQKNGDVSTTATGETINEQSKTDFSDVKVRSNFNETAFFYPHLKTNEKGEIIISFTIPESLTRWKLMTLSHTKDLEYSVDTREIVTQKDLMLLPNSPRFFRENDRISFPVKISSLSKDELKGEVRLEFIDPFTEKPISGLFAKGQKQTQSFTIAPEGNTNISWDLQIPEGLGAVSYRVVAKAGKFSDGEQKALPVLINRMLVTESLPLPVKGNSEKILQFEKLIQSGKSTTLRHHKLTLEFTSNPAWYAVQALPYIMEYPYECNEQTFSRYYANSLASHIANSDPKIKKVFDSWKNQDPEALKSNLEKNEELKSVLLQETPWVLDGKDETQRKHRLGLLFDLNRMSYERTEALKKLEKNQYANGGWPWFAGMPESRYITQHIVTGLGHLKHLGVLSADEKRSMRMTEKAIDYLDGEIRKEYRLLQRYYKKEELKQDHLSYMAVHYLYGRSFFTDKAIPSGSKEAFDYFLGQSKKYWKTRNKYSQGMIALALHRFNDKETPGKIAASLKEHSTVHEELGRYWKDNVAGWYWYQAPIETHALLIEVFTEVVDEPETVEELKIWLLKQKQTQDWKTTKATAEAIYALLLQGTDLLASDAITEVYLDNKLIDPNKIDGIRPQAGTGYFKTSWSGDEIKPEMGNVRLVKKDKGIAWGALYWQYFEQLDKITPHETPLSLKKQLFVERITDAGPVIEPLKGTDLKVGDKVIVRIELRSDRRMEYIHMKDMRASGFEPINVFSRYKYQDGLGYYESTKDASTNFFIEHLPKGTFVFEYPLRVAHKGDFSNGITTIQCMYAPEFTSHSEGVRVTVK